MLITDNQILIAARKLFNPSSRVQSILNDARNITLQYRVYAQKSIVSPITYAI